MCFGIVLTKAELRDYEVRNYDLRWQERFNQEYNRLQGILGAQAQIEHIGPTAVPGMSARPVLDIMVLLDDIEALKSQLRKLALLGYIDKGDSLDNGTRHFSKMGMMHLYIVPKGHEYAVEQSSFRDYLISNPETVKKCNDDPGFLEKIFTEFKAQKK